MFNKRKRKCKEGKRERNMNIENEIKSDRKVANVEKEINWRKLKSYRKELDLEGKLNEAERKRIKVKKRST